MARTPIHPGEHLKEELAELGLSASELARQIQVPPNRLTEIINGTRSVTADPALRLGHWFGTSADFWLKLQMLYDLRLAEHALTGTLASLPKRPRSARAAT
jgi:antitoxin HigA-1